MQFQTHKTCSRCKVEQERTAFSTRGKGSSLLSSWCRRCVSAAQADRYRRNIDREREARRPQQWRRKYGIGPEQYAELLAKQGGKCAICGTTDPGRGREYLCVDHDHSSGTVRGLLCSPCNYALGQFKDDPDLLRAALEYLR